ncbi:hypothetical protein ACFL1Q_01625, partial [Patescibacteria group bacterium]
MMKTMDYRKLIGIVFPAFLVLIGIFLSFKNYQPGTVLLGWDSLHPEFDFFLSFKRAFFGVWRQEQGLGVLTAHSHMADLPRVFFLWLSSFIIPASFLRYFYVFLCLILGPLGIYFLLRYIFGKRGIWVNLSSFLGGVFYLLNLVTLQHFLVPFEMFCVQYAFLPWIFLFVIKYLKGKGKKSLILFCLVTILSSPMAYA